MLLVCDRLFSAVGIQTQQPAHADAKTSSRHHQDKEKADKHRKRHFSTAGPMDDFETASGVKKVCLMLNIFTHWYLFHAIPRFPTDGGFHACYDPVETNCSGDTALCVVVVMGKGNSLSSACNLMWGATCWNYHDYLESTQSGEGCGNGGSMSQVPNRGDFWASYPPTHFHIGQPASGLSPYHQHQHYRHDAVQMPHGKPHMHSSSRSSSLELQPSLAEHAFADHGFADHRNVVTAGQAHRADNPGSWKLPAKPGNGGSWQPNKARASGTHQSPSGRHFNKEVRHLSIKILPDGRRVAPMG